MAILESQLETWSHQGSKVQSAATYGTIKATLEDANTPYMSRKFDVFLQGSYGNDTNIFAESDVDIVIRYLGEFYHDLSTLPADQQNAFHKSHSDGVYSYNTFKGHVQQTLEKAFGASVKPGKKAIKIEANGSRRNADVVVAFKFNRYHQFINPSNQRFDTGMAFFTPDNTRIANYPKQHSDNCTSKHQATGNRFKPIVRIFKNMRGKLADLGAIEKGLAPSYYIEGLLYNVPNACFSGSYSTTVLDILKWLHQTTDRGKFVCVNEQYYLLRDNNPVCWPIADGEKFIKAVVQLWNNS
jgi:hypothetical protein